MAFDGLFLDMVAHDAFFEVVVEVSCENRKQ